MTKTTLTACYTLEFKPQALRLLVEGGQSIAVTASTLGVVDQTQFNQQVVPGRQTHGRRLQHCERPADGDQPPVRARPARVNKMERDILGKMKAYLAKAAK